MELQNEEYNQIIDPAIQSAEKKAMAGFILGLIGIIAWILPIAGFPVTITGLVLSIKGKKSVGRKGLAIAGVVLNIIFLVFTAFNSFIGMILGILNAL